jgi:uncharacterized metal-binding protein YceD (DUF177 family)
VPAVHSLKGRFHLKPEPAGMVTATARLTAKLDRDCVVSLDVFTTRERHDFRLRFVPSGLEGDDGDPESDDEIPYAEGQIDLGEALVEQLALDLDPYPRKPDAALPEEAESPAISPFAALAALRGKA